MTPQRLVLRSLLLVTGRWISVEGGDRLRQIPDPAIFVFNHNNAYESILVPAALIFLRGGRRIRFLVDWMYLHIPVVGWILRQIKPIPVYRKRARWGLLERHRRAHLHQKPLEAARDHLLAGHSVGIFPEGRRNGDLHTLKRGRLGVGWLAMEAPVPVIPVGIEFPARHRMGKMPSFGRIQIRIGEPLDFTPQRPEIAALPSTDPARERQVPRQIVDTVMKALAPLCGKAFPQRPQSPREGPMRREIETTRITTEQDRLAAEAIIEEVYQREKRWVKEGQSEIPHNIADLRDQSWFLARIGGRPAGVIRLSYDPPLELPAELGVELETDIDLDVIARQCRFADIGRFMIRPRYRRNIRVALNLMKEAVREVVSRGYTHLLTDVFESDPHSPLHFHTRVLGFERIGTHRYGELSCQSLRIILVLDLARAYHRIKERKNKVLRELSEGLQQDFERLPQATVA